MGVLRRSTQGCWHPRADRVCALPIGPGVWPDDGVTLGPITVFLADDNLLVREGVRALLALQPDLEIVGVGADYDELVDGARRTHPQVVVTDIRMPPSFQNEGIDAAKEVRKGAPGTGI